MFSNLSRAEIYNRKVKGKSIYKIELKSTTFVKLTCVIINRNNFRARILNQIQIPARETSRSLGSRLRRSPLAIRDRLVGKSRGRLNQANFIQFIYILDYSLSSKLFYTQKSCMDRSLILASFDWFISPMRGKSLL